MRLLLAMLAAYVVALHAIAQTAPDTHAPSRALGSQPSGPSRPRSGIHVVSCATLVVTIRARATIYTGTSWTCGAALMAMALRQYTATRVIRIAICRDCMYRQVRRIGICHRRRIQ